MVNSNQGLYIYFITFSLIISTVTSGAAFAEEEVNEAIKLFTGLGIDPNVVDKNGETAMHGAAYRTFPKAVACLSECGADPKIWNKENKYGWTPLEIAHGNRPGSVKPSPETIRAIEQALKDGLKNK
jgi:ankyrin repeat protein